MGCTLKWGRRALPFLDVPERENFFVEEEKGKPDCLVGAMAERLLLLPPICIDFGAMVRLVEDGFFANQVYGAIGTT
jgi:hypothetical protein